MQSIPQLLYVGGFLWGSNLFMDSSAVAAKAGSPVCLVSTL